MRLSFLVRQKFTNLLYSLAEVPCLCSCSSLRKSVRIYLVSEAHTFTLGRHLAVCSHRKIIFSESEADQALSFFFFFFCMETGLCNSKGHKKIATYIRD